MSSVAVQNVREAWGFKCIAQPEWSLYTSKPVGIMRRYVAWFEKLTIDTQSIIDPLREDHSSMQVMRCRI